jgi:transcriptional regulator with PAS, ATPase and Fis domain
VLNIQAPGLRHHPEDIPQLAHHFLPKYSQLYRKPVESIEPDALALRQTYSWPGNVRKLDNVSKPSSWQRASASDRRPAGEHSGSGTACIRQRSAVGSFERLLRDDKIKLAHDAIQQCNGNKTLAAQRLSISRAYLHRPIREAPAEVLEMADERLPAVIGAGL